MANCSLPNGPAYCSSSASGALRWQFRRDEARRDPAGFPERYDALLRDTGNATASDLAERFGIELRVPEFWRAGLDVVRADIDRSEIKNIFRLG